MISFMPLYIDPGTGSMLFSLFIGIAATATFALRALFIKIKFILSGGKAEKKASETSIPYVIFSDHKRYWNVFKPICDEFENRKIELVYFTASKDDPVFEEKYNYVKAEFLGEKNKPYIRLNMLNADIVLSTTPGLDVLQWKRSKGVKWYVHVPHHVGDFASYRMFALDHYDSILASGENQLKTVRFLEKERKLQEKEFIIAGSTYLDSMKNRLDSFNNESKKNSDNPTVLIAPSWGKNGILSKFGDKLLAELQKTDFNIIIRPHPQSITSEKKLLDNLMEKYPDFEWNFDNDNFDVLNKSDIMISDFSGVIFDFTLIFDKPVIFTKANFDTSQYDADWLTEPMWELQVLNKIGIPLQEEDFFKISQIISETIKSKTLQVGRNVIRAQAWHNQNKAAETIVDYLIKKKTEFDNHL